MAAPIAVLTIQAIEAAIPGIIELWNAITKLRQQNPGLTAAQVTSLAQSMETQIGAFDADTLATLGQIQSPTEPAGAGANAQGS